jgi:unsaturated rhamnogalacturonyl hydrolase
MGLACAGALWAQAPDSSPTPAALPDPETLHATPPAYPLPYGQAGAAEVSAVLERVRAYLDKVTPARLVNRKTGAAQPDLKKAGEDDALERGAFSLTGYEWGVTYAGMLAAGEATGDPRYKDYVAERFKFLAAIYPRYRARMPVRPEHDATMRSVVRPASLDDSGSLCAAMIKAHRAGIDAPLRPMIDNFATYISAAQFRLDDGTLAREGPLPHTLWLDDLYMSVPALAQMGQLTGERRYFDDAVRQIHQFSERMFVKDKGLYMHGWAQEMPVHPAFHWGRANGWALLATVELLDVLPLDHPGRDEVLELLRAHVRGLAERQSGAGLWHQLLDRDDTYLETSASAMFVYAIAHAVSRGWIDPSVYGPMALLGWEAVAARVNAEGQVEGTCVGTGMAFDPTFYYYRPQSVYAAHGYGPVLLAGSEILRLIKQGTYEVEGGAIRFKVAPAAR